MSHIYEVLKNTAKPEFDSVLGLIKEQNQEAPARDANAVTALDLPDPVYTPSMKSHRYRVINLRMPNDAPIFPFDGMDPRTAEQYRILRTNIMQHPRRPAMMVVTSAGAGDGKTVTALNLAGTFALKRDGEVLLIDADLRRSTIATTLGIEQGAGLADVLRGTCLLEDAVVQTQELPFLHVLPAGTVKVNPAELLDSPMWKSIVSVLRQRFRYIVIDSTPMTAVADFQLVQASCDGIVLVTRPDYTNRKAVLNALSAIGKDKLIGVVINAVETWPFWKSEAAYY